MPTKKIKTPRKDKKQHKGSSTTSDKRQHNGTQAKLIVGVAIVLAVVIAFFLYSKPSSSVYLSQDQVRSVFFGGPVVNYTTYDITGPTPEPNKIGMPEPALKIMGDVQPAYNGSIEDGWATIAYNMTGISNRTAFIYVVAKVNNAAISGFNFGISMSNATSGTLNGVNYSYGTATVGGIAIGKMFIGSKGYYRVSAVALDDDVDDGMPIYLVPINGTALINAATQGIPAQ